ncbi:MAG TPA: Ig-like domain-containing protein [Plantibacter sp.]|uniref:Ig-like domain-containing protein n=1 Tax=unclassified Plantibacter TaxID=2624265 RepID=UPI002C0B6121|nr:Ig-like domain-containing protein [Plantibacter sp.]
MKLRKTLSAFGLIAVAASTLATGPSAFASVDDSAAQSAAQATAANAPGSAVFTVAGKFWSLDNSNAGSPQASAYDTPEQAEAASAQLTLPPIGQPGPIVSGSNTGVCLTPSPVGDKNRRWFSFAACSGAGSQDFELVEHGGGVVVKNVGAYLTVLKSNWSINYLAGGNLAEAAQVSGTAVTPAFGLTTPAVGAVIRDAQPTFSGVGAPGATIEIEDADGRLVATTTVGDDKAWSVQADEAFAEGTHTGTIRQITAANVVSTTPYEFEYAMVKDVAVTSPEIGGSVDVPRPVVSGTGQAGGEIELVFAEPNERTYKTTVGEDGTWSIAPTVSLKKGPVEGQVTQTFEGGVKQSAFNFTYGTVKPVTNVSLETPAAGATLKDARPVFSGAGENGATIEVVEGGNIIATATVSGGTWTTTAAADVALGAHAGSVNQKINGAQQSSVPFSFTREADVEQQPLVVASPAVGGSIVTDASGTVAPVFSGTATPGADVKVVTAWGHTVGTVKADDAGAWTLTWNKTLLPNTYAGGATIQSIDGKVIDRVGYNFTVTNSLSQEPLVVTSPAVGGTIVTDASGTVAPVFSGTATPGADVKVVTAWGDTVGTVKADATTGAWSLTWNKSLKPATYAGGNTIQSVNNVEIDRTGYRFTVQAAASKVVLTSPAIGGVISTGGATSISPVFTGTGDEGARIEIVGAWGTDLGKGVVKNGVWEITWANQYSPGTYSGGLVKQYLADGTALHSTVPYNFTITK